MSERKVLNKYYPPDFDHSKLEKVVRPRDKQDNVRMMLPMSVRCDTCGNFLYIGTKFNMRKETCLDENYLGIKIYRFYFKCSRCHAEVSMKTDPKNHDYVCEAGASRNYEPWRDIQHAEMVMKAKSQLEDDQDAMKKIERKGFNSRREMDVIDALNEVRMLNRRLGNVDHDKLIDDTLDRHKMEEKEENGEQAELSKSLHSSVIGKEADTESEGIAEPLTDQQLREKFAEMKRYKRLGNEDELNEDNFDNFIEEIDDPTVFFQAEKKVIRMNSKVKSALLPEEMMTMDSGLLKTNTKDKFKRALQASRSALVRPRPDDSLSKLQPEQKKLCTEETKEENSRNFCMADYSSSEGSD